MPASKRAARSTPAPSNTKESDRYIIELVGGGDTTVCVASRAEWNWLQNGGTPPADLVKRHAKGEDMSLADAQADLEGQTDDNDRAMTLSGCATQSYGSSSQAQRAITNAGHTTQGEYAGCLY